MRTHLNLPFPPSTNSLFKNRRGGRCKTARYLKWLADAEEMLSRQRTNKHTGNVAINIFAKKPDKRRRDLDNLAKGVCDFLVTHKIIADDSLIQFLSMKWVENPAGAYVIIEDMGAA